MKYKPSHKTVKHLRLSSRGKYTSLPAVVDCRARHRVALEAAASCSTQQETIAPPPTVQIHRHCKLKICQGESGLPLQLTIGTSANPALPRLNWKIVSSGRVWIAPLLLSDLLFNYPSFVTIKENWRRQGLQQTQFGTTFPHDRQL